MQSLGMDTIEYETLPGSPYGTVTQDKITHKRAKSSALSQQSTTRLQGTDITVKAHTQNTNNKQREAETLLRTYATKYFPY